MKSPRSTRFLTMGPSVIPAKALDWSVPVIAGAPQSKPSAPLPVPQRNVDDARLVGRSRCEVDMMGVFVQTNTASRMGKAHPQGYIIQENGCWDWVGYHRPSRGGNVYGYWWLNGRQTPAHRAMYERHKGTIPAGLTLDHLCRNTICVNPAHLEAVTGKENILRGNGIPARNARKTHCPKGHPLTPRKNSTRRECRLCLPKDR